MTNSFLRKPSRQSELLDVDKKTHYFQIHIAGSSKLSLHIAGSSKFRTGTLTHILIPKEKN